jgi:kynurenine formamidase
MKGRIGLVIYDLSHAIENGMTYFPGDPEPRLTPWPVDVPWHVSELRLGSHCGTHLDAPLHLSAGPSVDALSLSRLMGRGVVIDVPGKQPGDHINPSDVLMAEPLLQQGVWLVLRTGWSRYWGSPAYFAHPSLDPELAHAIVAWGVDLVAMDLLSPDDTAGGASIVHEILLGAGILIVENLTGLNQLTAGNTYMFSFLPLKLAGVDGSPVRAVAWRSGLPFQT